MLINVTTSTNAIGPAYGVRCFKADGRRAVWLVQRPGQSATTVKCWPLTPALAVKLLLGRSQAQRQARGIDWLTAAGITTTPVVRPWRVTRYGRRLMVELALAHAPGRTVHELVEAGAFADDVLARRAGQWVGETAAAVVRARLFHDDFKPSNLVLDLEPAEPRLVVIDTASLHRPRRYQPAAVLAEMLHKLNIPLREAEVAVPAALWRAVLRSALSGGTRAERREVVARLRRLHAARQAWRERAAS